MDQTATEMACVPIFFQNFEISWIRVKRPEFLSRKQPLVFQIIGLHVSVRCW